MLIGLYVFILVFSLLWAILSGVSVTATISDIIKNPQTTTDYKLFVKELLVFTISLSLMLATILGRLL